jgi:hypothetical protein
MDEFLVVGASVQQPGKMAPRDAKPRRGRSHVAAYPSFLEERLALGAITAATLCAMAIRVYTAPPTGAGAASASTTRRPRSSFLAVRGEADLFRYLTFTCPLVTLMSGMSGWSRHVKGVPGIVKLI